LRVGRIADATTWDPKFTNDNPSLWAQHQVIGMLMSNTPDGKGLEPFIAESYDISDDGKVYSFKIRDNAAFCDGSPITAGDVRFSLERAMEEDSNVSWQYPSKPTVEVVDDKNLTLTLGKPNAAFLSYLTLWGTGIVSEKYATEVGDERLGQEPLGSSAFCLASWEKGQKITLERNPHFWFEGQPVVDTVELSIITDDNARILELQGGNIDIALDVAYSQIAALKNDPNINVGTSLLYGTAAIVPNLRTKPEFTDINVRQAMNYAVDRQAMVNAVLLGAGEPAMSFFAGPGILFYNGEYGYQFDLAKAQELMAASQYPDGFTSDLIIPSGDSVAQQTAVVLKDQLAKINITLNITPLESGTWWDRWSNGEFEMVYKLGTNDIIDPAENIPFDFWSKQDGGSDGAFSGFSDPAITKLSQEAEAEMDLEKRAALYDELQKIVMQAAPQIWLFHPVNRWATSKSITNFEIPSTGLYRFWLVEKQQ